MSNITLLCQSASLGSTPKCCPIGEVLEYDTDTIYKCTKNEQFLWETKDLTGFQTFCQSPRYRVLVDTDVVETFSNGTIVVNGEHYKRDTFCLESLGTELTIVTCDRAAIMNKCNALNDIVTGVNRVVPQQMSVIQQIWSIFTDKNIEMKYKKLECKENNEFCHALAQNIIEEVEVTPSGDIIFINLELKGEYCIDYKVTGDYEGFYMCRCGINDAFRITYNW